MQHKRPVPLFDSFGRPRRLCPVCGAASYSREGIHPQCAVERADASRMARVKAAKNTAKRHSTQTETLVLLPWHKRCPKCAGQMHIRKATCECGHRFGS